MWRVLCVMQFFVMLVIYTYLGLTSHPETQIPVFNDLLMHFAGYSVAGISISFAFPYWPLWQRASCLIGYSVLIEILQHFNPPRTFSVLDILANSGGVALGLLIIIVLQKYLPGFTRLLHWQLHNRNGMQP